jgi:hypothetical protein
MGEGDRRRPLAVQRLAVARGPGEGSRLVEVMGQQPTPSGNRYLAVWLILLSRGRVQAASINGQPAELGAVPGIVLDLARTAAWGADSDGAVRHLPTGWLSWPPRQG